MPFIIFLKNVTNECDLTFVQSLNCVSHLLYYYSDIANRETRNAGVLRWQWHCNHSRDLRRRKSQNVSQIAFHCNHTTSRDELRRKSRIKNRAIETLPSAEGTHQSRCAFANRAEKKSLNYEIIK